MSFYNIEKTNDSLIVKFKNETKAITSSFLNEGYKTDIQAVFNHNLSQENLDKLVNNNILKYLENKSTSLGLNPKHSQCLITSAKISNSAISKKTYKKIEIVTIATAGVRVNASCAGDPASYYEENGNFHLNLGTINLIILIDGNLDELPLLEGIITATEAKSAVLKELMIASKFSKKIATGTGTDGISIIANNNSSNYFTNAGKHSKLGELIGLSVIEAIKMALRLEMNLSPESQFNALVRISRIENESREFYDSLGDINKLKVIKSLKEHMKDDTVVIITSLIINLIDQVNNNLIPKKTAYKIAMHNIDSFLNESKYFYYKKLLTYLSNKYLKIS